MNEAAFTLHLKKKFEEKDYYFKKMRNTSVKGIPDVFISKDHKGVFCEIKLIEMLRKVPIHFTQWSLLTRENSVQLMTAIELDTHFLCRYIICYRVKNINYLCMIKPAILKAGKDAANLGLSKQAEVVIKPVEEDVFIYQFAQFLQI